MNPQRHPLTIVSLAASIACLVLIGVVPEAGAVEWTIETVDASADVGEYSSMELGEDGNPHIAYYDHTNSALKYCTKILGIWLVATATASGNSGSYCSLALDSEGNPRVTYYESITGNLEYIQKNGGVWYDEDVMTPIVFFSSLALDTWNRPHVASYDGNLVYSYKHATSWISETVDADPNAGGYCSLVLDLFGDPHISYFDDINNTLRYATKATGSWVIDVVDAAGPVGGFTSLATDAAGDPHISYFDFSNNQLKYAYKNGGSWTVEVVDSDGLTGQYTSIAVDSDGVPHISYHNITDRALLYAVKTDKGWKTEFVDAVGVTGQHTSIAVDAWGNPKISYYDASLGDLKFADSAPGVTLLAPAGGETWPVGAERQIEWAGIGPVNLSLSTDGGASYESLHPGPTDNVVTIRVPHAPTRFARVRVERAVPFGVSESDSFFTIDASVIISMFKAAPVGTDGGGALVSWATRPGPEDLAGYRLECDRGRGSWVTLEERTRETSCVDAMAAPGTRYRLTAINGLDEELMLGETTFLSAAPLAAWPLPYRGGPLEISFATSGGLGGGAGQAEVMLYDASGRRVSTISQGWFEAGYQRASWNGRDDGGRRVSPGVYFLRSRSGGEEQVLKLVVMQ